jgi:hypothetical protein
VFLPFLEKVWKAIKAGARWLADHWYIPLFVAGVVLGFVLSGKPGRPKPGARTKVELDAIKAKADARKLAAERGHTAAKLEVTARYALRKAQLTEEQQREAEALREDPPALAAYLVRAGARDRR